MGRAPRTFSRAIREPAACPADQPFPLCDNPSCLTRKHASEIETLLSIQQAITSQLNLAEVLQLIADEAQKLTSARISLVYVLEGDELVLAAISGFEQAGQFIGYRVPLGHSLAGQSIRTRQPIMIGDVQEDDARIYAEAIRPFGNIGCYLTVPLIYGERSLGVIAVADQCRAVFGGDSLRVLSMLAPSAVIGIENARLYQEQQERRLEAESRHQMAESLRVMLAIVNSNRSLSEVLEYIVNQVSSRLLDCQATAIFTLQPKDKNLRIQAAHGLSADLAEARSLPGYAAACEAVETGQPIIVTSPGADQTRCGYHAWIAVPLIVKGEPYGAIGMYYREPHDFSKEEINLALMFSDEVALAIENARLRYQAEQAAVIAERNRLARELHDAVSQTLFSANLIAEVLPRLWERDQPEARQRLTELSQLTRGAQAEMRTLLFELRPAVFEEAWLGDLLKHLTQAISVRSQIQIQLTVEGKHKLPAEVQIALYRITQEALSNVIKHSNASRAEVYLNTRPDRVELSISDDGCGFDPARVASEHFGLSIMRERAAGINAVLEVLSQPGCQTLVRVVWTNSSHRG